MHGDVEVALRGHAVASIADRPVDEGLGAGLGAVALHGLHLGGHVGQFGLEGGDQLALLAAAGLGRPGRGQDVLGLGALGQAQDHADLAHLRLQLGGLRALAHAGVDRGDHVVVGRVLLQAELAGQGLTKRHCALQVQPGHAQQVRSVDEARVGDRGDVPGTVRHQHRRDPAVGPLGDQATAFGGPVDTAPDPALADFHLDDPADRVRPAAVLGGQVGGVVDVDLDLGSALEAAVDDRLQRRALQAIGAAAVRGLHQAVGRRGQQVDPLRRVRARLGSGERLLGHHGDMGVRPHGRIIADFARPHHPQALADGAERKR